jgi:hypothetical protein
VQDRVLAEATRGANLQTETEDLDMKNHGISLQVLLGTMALLSSSSLSAATVTTVPGVSCKLFIGASNNLAYSGTDLINYGTNLDYGICTFQLESSASYTSFSALGVYTSEWLSSPCTLYANNGPLSYSYYNGTGASVRRACYPTCQPAQYTTTWSNISLSTQAVQISCPLYNNERIEYVQATH